MEINKITGFDIVIRYTNISGTSVRTYDLCHINVDDGCYSNDICEAISCYLNHRNSTATVLREDKIKIEEIRKIFRKGERIPFPENTNHIILDCPNIVADDETYHLSLGIWRVPSISKMSPF